MAAALRGGGGSPVRGLEAATLCPQAVALCISGELGVVVLFGPLLTYLFIRGKERLLSRYAALAARSSGGGVGGGGRPFLSAAYANTMLPPLLSSPGYTGAACGAGCQQSVVGRSLVGPQEGFWNLAAEHTPAPEPPGSGSSGTRTMGGGPLEQMTLIANAVSSSSSAPGDLSRAGRPPSAAGLGGYPMLFAPIVGETPLRELWENS